MIKSIFAACLIVAASSPFCLAEAVELETEVQKFSYLYGSQFAAWMKHQEREVAFTFAFDSVVEGFKDANAGTKSKISDAEVQALTTKLDQELETRKLAKKDGKQIAVDETETKNVSYIFGRQLAEHIKDRERFSIYDTDSVLAGFKDANAGIELKVAETEFKSLEAKVSQEFNTRKQAEREAEQKKMDAEAQVNKEAGKKFLEDNKKREGVTVTPSGLQYEVLKKEEGAKPPYNGYILVHYHGALIDGTVIDGSKERGEPILHRVSHIPGWSEGIELMSVGSKFKLFIPSDLAYGDSGHVPEKGPGIGPGQTLIYEVELVKIFSSTEEAQNYEDSKKSTE